MDMKMQKTQKVMYLNTGCSEDLEIIRCRMDVSAPDQYKLYRTYWEHGTKHRKLYGTYETRYMAVSAATKYLYQIVYC